jgi:hypothetical protein
MQTAFGKMDCFRCWILPHLKRLHPVEKGSGWILVIRALVNQGPRPAGSIPLLTGCHAGMTAYAYIQINYQSQLCHLFILWQVI